VNRPGIPAACAAFASLSRSAPDILTRGFFSAQGNNQGVVTLSFTVSAPVPR
jgi:hypothetical protein